MQVDGEGAGVVQLDILFGVVRAPEVCFRDEDALAGRDLWRRELVVVPDGEVVGSGRCVRGIQAGWRGTKVGAEYGSICVCQAWGRELVIEAKSAVRVGAVGK